MGVFALRSKETKTRLGIIAKPAVGCPKTRSNKMDDYNKQSAQSPYGESAGTGATGTAARLKEQISEKAADVKEKVAEFGRKTADKIDESRESAAGALDKTASSLHSGGDKLSGVSHSAADKIQATADYVRRTDLKGMAEDVQDLVKRYPGQALVAAVILGFLVARGLRSSD
jgi:ElaB/YqjD/DUF883 family membrane-anchored ribosome-binding protein